MLQLDRQTDLTHYTIEQTVDEDRQQQESVCPTDRTNGGQRGACTSQHVSGARHTYIGTYALLPTDTTMAGADGRIITSTVVTCLLAYLLHVARSDNHRPVIDTTQHRDLPPLPRAPNCSK